MGNRTLWQLAFMAFTLGMLPMFVLGLLCGIVFYMFECGYFWGRWWCDSLYENAHGETAAWRVTVNINRPV